LFDIRAVENSLCGIDSWIWSEKAIVTNIRSQFEERCQIESKTIC